MRVKPCSVCYLLIVFCLAPSARAVDGDVNIDGQVDAADVIWSNQVLFDSRTLSPEQQLQGDLAPLISGVPHPDGLFDLGDALLISRIALGLINFSFPENQFNIGDSIGEGEAADGTIGEAHHETVWSTGYQDSDVVDSLNERFESVTAADYHENNTSRDPVFNHAVSGAVMADFATQAEGIVAASAMTPTGQAGMVSVFLGSNDVCAPSNEEMTDHASFDTQYRAGLDVLASSDATRNAQIHVTGVPAIYWLWNAKYSRFWCWAVAWPFVPCENLLDDPEDDCESNASRLDPDNNDYDGDGVACKRRKTFHSLVRDYNTILHDTLEEYRASGSLPNARYTDIYDVKFESVHVNNGDCFHPSSEGHALLADKAWCRTHWGIGDPTCNN